MCSDVLELSPSMCGTDTSTGVDFSMRKGFLLQSPFELVPLALLDLHHSHPSHLTVYSMSSHLGTSQYWSPSLSLPRSNGLNTAGWRCKLSCFFMLRKSCGFCSCCCCLLVCLFFFLVKEILRNSEGGVSVSTASLQRSEKNSKMMTFNGNV